MLRRPDGDAVLALVRAPAWSAVRQTAAASVPAVDSPQPRVDDELLGRDTTGGEVQRQPSIPDSTTAAGAPEGPASAALEASAFSSRTDGRTTAATAPRPTDALSPPASRSFATPRPGLEQPVENAAAEIPWHGSESPTAATSLGTHASSVEQGRCSGTARGAALPAGPAGGEQGSQTLGADGAPALDAPLGAQPPNTAGHLALIHAARPVPRIPGEQRLESEAVGPWPHAVEWTLPPLSLEATKRGSRYCWQGGRRAARDGTAAVRDHALGGAARRPRRTRGKGRSNVQPRSGGWGRLRRPRSPSDTSSWMAAEQRRHAQAAARQAALGQELSR